MSSLVNNNNFIKKTFQVNTWKVSLKLLIINYSFDDYLKDILIGAGVHDLCIDMTNPEHGWQLAYVNRKAITSKS
jgi:hypothetical protein